MRTTIFILFCCLFASCSKEQEQPIGPDDYELIFLRSFIYLYYDGPFHVTSHKKEYGQETICMSISSGPDQTYQNPDAGGKGTSAEKFVSISERNGDLAYNKEDYPLNYTQRICAATNIAAIDLVCQTKAWDRDHPAGTSLNDITKIETYTYAPYVRQGYQGWYPIQIFKFLAVLEPTELSMIEPSFYLYIGGSPAPDTYLIEIRIKTTEGETQTVIYPLTVNS